jgi:uncharacterized membrane protein YukC
MKISIKSVKIALESLNRELVFLKATLSDEKIKSVVKEYNQKLIEDMEDAKKELQEEIAKEAEKDGIERNYCLACRKEIMTESGDICPECARMW